jgi:hypothetical protein
LVFGAGLLAAVSLGCSIDDTGLAETSVKLQRDGGGTGGSVAATSSGGTTGSGGTTAAGGASGSGGTVATGGATGEGGTTGSGGATGTGGATGDGGATGTGGMSGSGGTTGSAGATATGTGGTTASGGTTGSGGVTGSGGTMATGGTTGTGGTTASGGASGTAGATGSGGTTGGTGGGGGMKCGPGNCDGCCSSNGQCVRNVTAKQCGSMGAACTTCAPCEICSGSGASAGACAIDPSSQWTIVAESAQVSMTPPGGGTWDPMHGDEGGSAPDLFCEYENPANDVSPTTAGVTDTVTDVFTANWDQTITPPGVSVSAAALMASKPVWRIWVGDEDCTTPNNCGTLGQIACSYQQSLSAASLESGQAVISNFQNCVSLTLSLVCQAPSVATP